MNAGDERSEGDLIQGRWGESGEAETDRGRGRGNEGWRWGAWDGHQDGYESDLLRPSLGQASSDGSVPSPLAWGHSPG